MMKVVVGMDQLMTQMVVCMSFYRLITCYCPCWWKRFL